MNPHPNRNRLKGKGALTKKQATQRRSSAPYRFLCIRSRLDLKTQWNPVVFISRNPERRNSENCLSIVQADSESEFKDEIKIGRKQVSTGFFDEESGEIR